QLSGPLLNEEHETTQQSLYKFQKGHFATGQCDGWKDISKNHLIAFLIRVTHVQDVSAEAKTADNLLQLILNEKDYIEGMLGMKLIGWVSDAGGDSRAACLCLHGLFPNLLIADCYAHQV
ncbi:hypothetical protein BS47DRAFT_1260095, partial [Hydnum rufescens UP504]